MIYCFFVKFPVIFQGWGLFFVFIRRLFGNIFSSHPATVVGGIMCNVRGIKYVEVGLIWGEGAPVV